jgi:hypothetical protein
VIAQVEPAADSRHVGDQQLVEGVEERDRADRHPDQHLPAGGGQPVEPGADPQRGGRG